MLYHHQEHTIDLTKVTRLYPAALVRLGKETASVSLEWAAMKEEKIILELYVLICDFDPIGEVPTHRVELLFETKEKLFEAMTTISHLVNQTP
jgi:hypothetical protein